MKHEIKLKAACARPGLVVCAIAASTFLIWECLVALIPASPASAQVAVPGQPLVPLGYCQLTSIDAAAALTACSDGIPSGATCAIITAEAQAVRWRDDATNPSATVGMPVAVGAPFFYAGMLSKFRVISQTSGAKLNVSFYRQ